MYLKNPEYFLTIVKERSISRAAEKLYLSQPYLSQYLAKLESNLGVTLLGAAASLGTVAVMTLLINFLGSVAIGAIVETSELAAGALSREAVLFLKVGLCGGFTTFSTFSLETLELIEVGQYAIAGAYALVSVVLCVAGVLVGKVLARALMPTG